MPVLSLAAYQYLLHYKLSIPKISTCTNFTNICMIPIEKFIKLLEFTITSCIFCFNKTFYKQLQSATMGSPVSTTSPQKHPKAELKDFTIIDRESNTLHHPAKEALHICIKYPSLNRNIGKVSISSVFNKLLKLPRQLELPHSSNPPTSFTWSFNIKDN